MEIYVGNIFSCSTIEYSLLLNVFMNSTVSSSLTFSYFLGSLIEMSFPFLFSSLSAKTLVYIPVHFELADF